MTQHPAVEAFRGGPDVIRVVGHRGARGLLPENSIIGFEFALKAGAPLLEFDVILSADGVPVITHNHRLHAPTFRAPDGRYITTEPKVAEMTWAELQRYDIGSTDGTSAYGQRFPEQAQLDGIRVPRLRDLLRLIAQPDNSQAYLMLEIKSDTDIAKDQAYRAHLVETVLAELRETGTTRRALLHSFDWGLLAECRRLAPEMPTSFLTQLPSNADDVGEDSAKAISPDFTGKAEQIPEMVAQHGGALWCPYVDDVTPSNVALAKELGLIVAVWTVNDIADIDRMIALQIDAIVTDYPGRVQRRLADQGIRWLGFDDHMAVATQPA